MRALIVGAHGQVGRALIAAAPTGATIVAHGLDTLDITDARAVMAAVADARPDIVFNAAAYTDVDRAESEEARAMAINGAAVATLSAATQNAGARLIHISTDYVFDGTADLPYPPDAAPDPLSTYGRSKLMGERAAGEGALIVRTAWVHSAHGSNFVRTMLRLMAERDVVRVVADQIGTPTAAPSLAATLWALAGQGATGIWHHTDAGVASRYDVAVAVQEEAVAMGLLARAVPVLPIATAGHPTPAHRPVWSVLDTGATTARTGIAPLHWRVGVRNTLAEIARHG